MVYFVNASAKTYSLKSIKFRPHLVMELKAIYIRPNQKKGVVQVTDSLRGRVGR
jgi:hypothetical protein